MTPKDDTPDAEQAKLTNIVFSDKSEFEAKVGEFLDEVNKGKWPGIDIHSYRSDYLIFSKRDLGKSPRDVGAIKVWSQSNDKLTEIYSEVAKIKEKEIQLKSVLYSIGLHNPPTYESMIRRGLEYLAEAYSLAILRKPDKAVEILRPFIKMVSDRRDSYNRMKFTWANLFSLMVIGIIWALIRSELSFPFTLNQYIVDFATINQTIQIGSKGSTVHLIDILVLGAIGAFFSVQSKVKDIKISHAITGREIAYTGFVRVPVGLIAAGVVVLLVKGDWFLGSVEDSLKIYAVYLLAFIAGFSEKFVPNALESVAEDEQEKSARRLENRMDQLQVELDHRLTTFEETLKSSNSDPQAQGLR